MKATTNFIYLTPLQFPASSGMHVYIRELAKGFATALEDKFLLSVRSTASLELDGINYQSVNFPFLRFRTLFYFCWLPLFVFKKSIMGKEIVFFANDPNILVVLIIWKKIFCYHLVSDWHQLIGDWRDAFIAGNSDYLVTTSLKLKKTLTDKLSVNESKILVAYGGVDLSRGRVDRDKARSLVNLSLVKKYVGYMGFFRAVGMEKGLNVMIEALSNLDPDVNVLLVGGKPEEIAEYEKLAKRLGVRERCVFFGRKTQEELALYEAACDILVIPYPDKPHFRDYGFPMKVYEYMASGRPIIYSKLELVEEVLGEDSMPFIPDSVNDFVRAVNEVFVHYDEWAKKADSSFKKLALYTWEKKAENILNFVKK